MTGPNLDGLMVSKKKKKTARLFECCSRMTPAVQVCLSHSQERRGAKGLVSLIHFIFSTALRRKWIWTSTPSAKEVKLHVCSN